MGHSPITRWGNHPIDSTSGTWYAKTESLARPSFGDYRVVPLARFNRVRGGSRRRVRTMEGQSNVLLIILLFILRLGIPVLVTAAIAYGLHRLDARWQAEAEAEAKAQTKSVAPLAPRPQSTRTGASGGNGAGINMPLHQPLPVAFAAGQPCWSIKGCSESMRATCAAFHQPNVPCWSARMNAEGRLPAGCKECKIYQPTAPVWTEQGVILH